MWDHTLTNNLLAGNQEIKGSGEVYLVSSHLISMILSARFELKSWLLLIVSVYYLNMPMVSVQPGEVKPYH